MRYSRIERLGLLCCAALAACSGGDGAGGITRLGSAGSAGGAAGAYSASAGRAAGGASGGPGTGAAGSASADAGSGGSGTAGMGAGMGTGGRAVAGGAGVPASGGTSGGFPSVTDLAAPGPFATNNPLGVMEGPGCSVHRPAELGAGGLRHPVLIWGMGTGGFNTYQGTFDLWASHGFVVSAALLGDGQGDGAEMIACLDYVCEHYASAVDCRAVGASGHSQGGGGAIMAGRDARVVTTAPVQPYVAQGFGGFDQASIAQQHGPMLLLSGSADAIAVPALHQQPVFDMANVPVFWGNLIGGDHVVTGIDGIARYREVILGWWRLQLMGDESFRELFYGADCRLCQDSAWIVMRDGIN